MLGRKAFAVADESTQAKRATIMKGEVAGICVFWWLVCWRMYDNELLGAVAARAVFAKPLRDPVCCSHRVRAAVEVGVQQSRFPK